MSFKKKVEDFTCEHCGSVVAGTGYTNHCPKCLWSKHVDISPGDRAAACGGMMEPIAIEGTARRYSIVYRCLRCKAVRRNRTDAGDDMETVVAIAKRHNHGIL